MELDKANKIAQLCIEQYNKLPKTGKPTAEEWTVAAAIVEETEQMEVVSLGTGSKCVGGKSLVVDGSILHDAHAEVVARRGFLVYLMEQVRSCMNGGPTIFEKRDGKFLLRDNVKFFFFTTVVPCGDAAIIPMDEKVGLGKRKAGEHEEGTQRKIMKESETEIADVHRTGAKCLPEAEVQDSRENGKKYHEVAQVRTKPGRGDPTASVSCSDKMARWNAVGVQGALLSLFLQSPITFDAIIVAGEVPFSTAVLNRAISKRIGKENYPTFIQSTVTFPAQKSEERIRPAPSSIAWNISTNKVQVCVAGRLLGATKKKPNQSALSISKKCLFERFVGLCKSNELVGVDVSALTYKEAKTLSDVYKKSWLTTKEKYFKVWTTKPVETESFYAQNCVAK